MATISLLLGYKYPPIRASSLFFPLLSFSLHFSCAPLPPPRPRSPLILLPSISFTFSTYRIHAGDSPFSSFADFSVSFQLLMLVSVSFFFCLVLNPSYAFVSRSVPNFSIKFFFFSGYLCYYASLICSNEVLASSGNGKKHASF